MLPFYLAESSCFKLWEAVIVPTYQGCCGGTRDYAIADVIY